MKPETVLQIDIVEVLSILCRRPEHEFMFFSIPNEGYMLGVSKKGFVARIDNSILTMLKKMGMCPGASDLVILQKGKAFCMEVKDEDGVPTRNQILFRAWCERNEVPYAIVRSVPQAVDQLRIWKIIL